ncbi:MAG: glycosyltransferase family 4 protein [Limnohabitans sp.]|jgi:glycosyltransferase involved in cell wall biosynthesis
MKVAFNAVALLSPKTGIGRYVWNLATQLQQMPALEPCFFHGLGWSMQCQAPMAESLREVLPKLRSRLPWSYEIRRWIQSLTFKVGARNKGLQLYHEPNHLLLPFEGPTVLTVHDLSWIRYPAMHPVERVRAMDKHFENSLRRATRILTDSEFVKQELVDVFGMRPESIHPVHLGVEALFRPLDSAQTAQVLQQFGLMHGQYLLAVGTLEPRKNLGVALRAFMALPPARRKQCPLVLVGMRGWHTSALERQLAPLIRNGEVRQLGYLSRAHLAVVTAGACALVYPSVYEGFGLPPLEAMACRVPVIASNSASIPEVVGSSGILIDPQDEVHLTQAMLTMIEQPEVRDALAEQALQRSHAFSWNRCVRETVAVYRAVI